MIKEKLIADCSKGNRRAQRVLYDRYADKLMNICLRYARDRAEAQDVLQNAFVKIFTKISDFKTGEGSFEGWMSRIAVNEALMLYRKNKRIFYPDEEVIAMNMPAAAPAAVDNLQAEDVIKLLEKLPDGYRVVFNLHVVEGYSHDEIGEMLGITSGASRSQLTRAKKNLRIMLKEQKIYGYVG